MCVCLQMYIDAQYTDLKLPVDIVIGTVPLIESFRSLPAPQYQTVITHQPPSAPPITQQPDELRMSCLCSLFWSHDLELMVAVFKSCNTF